ncbi:MAG: hypothetical protein A2X19_06075 [Bacteroidetes bacterium GWE2_39_28]|nr:MAG: hypothetical protein A2X19_06075 [Bacteroidetes bacterium GWE2_39_28]OFY12810.1 MAG: hypothetical protein A2X16_00855 [Bacteroidetes bacterium GWF2_39_10]OFZ11032.1 MAG: hypothetical protein A2465_00890 [Bacteroidetes bacterium RIFOXYC2_FULL_39_11]HCT93711.1 hypothetical protein [Rikenellaceae bacterium]
MRAGDYNSKEFSELIQAVIATSTKESIPSDQRGLVLKFFKENAELEYNEFLTLYNEKYGNIIKQYRAILKAKTLKRIHFAATLFVISFFASLIAGVIWFIYIFLVGIY